MFTKYYKICRIWLLLQILLVTFPVLGAVKIAFREKQNWAVIIAISEHEDNRWGSRPKAVENADSLARILRERYSYRKENVRELYNKEAVREKILEVLREIGAEGSPNDSVFIYIDVFITRHSESFESIHGPEWPTFLVPFDGKKDDFDTLLNSSEFYYLIKRYLPTQSIFIVINGYVEPSRDYTRSIEQQSTKQSYPRRLFQIISLTEPRNLGIELASILDTARRTVSAWDIYRALSSGKQGFVRFESMTDSPMHFVFEVQSDSLSRERVDDLLDRNRPAQERIEQITELITSIKTSPDDLSGLVLDVLFEIARNESDEMSVRRQAIWAIGQLKNQNSVDALNELYKKTSDTSLRRSILETLLELDSNSTIPLLRSAALDKNSALARYALRSLSYLEDEGSLDTVQIIFKKTNNPEVLISALDALPSLGAKGPEAQARLLQLFSHPESSVRQQAIRTLTRIPGGAESSNSEIVDAVIRLLLEDKSADVRQTAAYALAELHTPEKTSRILPPLLKALDYDEPSVRRAVIFSLGRIRAAEAAYQLLAHAVDKDEDQSVRVAAIEALGRIGITSGAEKRFIRLVREEKSPEIRLAAVIALSNSRDPEAIAVLLKAADDSDFYVAKAAGDALQNISANNPDDFIDLLNQSGLQNPEPDVQIQVIQSLSKIENSDTALLLIKKLGSTNPDIREAAIAGLSNFMSEDSTEIMVKELYNPNPLVRSGIATIMGDSKKTRFAPVLLDRLSIERDDDVRAEIIRSLANYDNENALEAVRSIANEKHNRSTALAVAAFYDKEADRQVVRKELDKAMYFADQALSIRKRFGFAEEAKGLIKKGELLVQQGQKEEALRTYESALTLQSKELPSEDVRLAGTRKRIGLLLAELEQFAAAERYLLEALNIYQKNLGPDYQEVSSTFKELAQLYDSIGESRRRLLAERQYRESSSTRYLEKLLDWRFQGWISYRTQYGFQSITSKWIAELDGKTTFEPDEKKILSLLTIYIDIDTRPEQMRASELEKIVKGLDLPISQSKK